MVPRMEWDAWNLQAAHDYRSMHPIVVVVVDTLFIRLLLVIVWEQVPAASRGVVCS